MLVPLAGLALVGGGCVDSNVRQRIAERDSIIGGLLATSQPTPQEAASWASDPYDADKRARGVTLLAGAPFGGEQVYIRRYLELLSDESSNVRAAACRALGNHGSPDHVPQITPLLQDDDRHVRLEAAKALQRVYNPVAAGPLIDRVDPNVESEPDIRAAAAVALGQYAEGRVVDRLIAALDDDSYLVTHSAAESLRTLTGQPFEDDLGQWTRWASGNHDLFADRRAFYYPYFERDRRWLDYLPFAPAVPNEIPAKPAGFPDLGPEAGRDTASAS